MCAHTHSNGIGRTGAFITLHVQLERLKIEGVVDVLQFIKSARRKREGLVNNAVSLQFVVLTLYTVLLALNNPT